MGEIALIVLFIITVMAFYLATMFNYHSFYSKQTIDANFGSEDEPKNNSGSKIMELDVENDFGSNDREKEADPDAINDDVERPESIRETDTGRNFIESD